MLLFVINYDKFSARLPPIMPLSLRHYANRDFWYRGCTEVGGGGLYGPRDYRKGGGVEMRVNYTQTDVNTEGNGPTA